MKIVMLKLMALLLVVVSVGVVEAKENEFSLRITTLNMYHGGVRLGQPLSQSVKAIQAAKADIVGVQETHAGNTDNAEAMAKILGWHHFAQGARTSVISKFPIVGHTPRKWGVHIKLPDATIVHFYNAHLNHIPYQPYQLARIPYGDYPFIKTEKEAINWAKQARGGQTERLIGEISASLKADTVCFLTGDFNEPSHQDWTEKVAATGRIPIKVDYPVTKTVTEAGLHDGFRSFYSDPIKYPGWTWTPTTKPTDPKDRHDRIDFVFSSLPVKAIRFAAVVGEAKENAGIVVSPWPTDHRSVVVEYSLETPP